VVERILIHLERQTPPDVFRAYGPRVVPFYNYLQAALVIFEDGRLEARGVLSVASELVVQHRFDGEALARSYAELGRRGHLRGTCVDDLEEAYAGWAGRETVPGGEALATFVKGVREAAASVAENWRGDEPATIDYDALVTSHNPRKKR
jgi:hypothetical protein